MSSRKQSLFVGLAMIPIAGLVIWLATKMARTSQGDYRLLIIGGAMVFMTLVIAIGAAVQRLRR